MTENEVKEEKIPLQRGFESDEPKNLALKTASEAGSGDTDSGDSGRGEKNENVGAGEGSSDARLKEREDKKQSFRRAFRQLSGTGTDSEDPPECSSSSETAGSPFRLSTSSSRETLDCTDLFLAAMLKKTNIYSTEAIPLNNPWTFWVERSKRGVAVEEFEANLKRIYTVYTVHLFWGVFYNIPLPSTLHIRSSLHMTRDERKPIWEESYNRDGGTFRMIVNKRDTDKVWRELLMAAVGEQLNEYVGPNDEICGVSVSAREREDIVLIWNTNAKEHHLARVFDCVHLLLPDTVFVSDYKPHYSHISYGKHKDVGAHSSKSSNSLFGNGNGHGSGSH